MKLVLFMLSDGVGYFVCVGMIEMKWRAIKSIFAPVKGWVGFSFALFFARVQQTTQA